MSRREFLTKAGKGAVIGAGLAAAAGGVRAQGQAQTVRWRMATLWPRSFDITFATAEGLAKRVGELTEGRFEIRATAAGELVPPPQVFDAVQNGSVECGHVLSSVWFGKNAAFGFDTGMPFGLNSRQQNAWMHWGGGNALMRELFAKYNMLSFQVGSGGVQMGGWYRKEINTVADLKGLKMRIAGIGGAILSKLGVVPQQLPVGEIYTSLERGLIDAVELVGPHDDEKFGFHKVTKYYYTPGWWEGSAECSLLVNQKAWDALPKSFQAALECAAAEQETVYNAHYDAKNAEALKRLVGAGVQLRQFPRAIMDACYKVTEEVLDEYAAKNADFKKIYDSWRPFRDDQNLWFRLAENVLDNYRYSVKRPTPAKK